MDFKKIQNKIILKYKLPKAFYTQKLIKKLFYEINNNSLWDATELEIKEEFFSGKSFENFYRQYSGNKYFQKKNDKLFMGKEYVVYLIKCFKLEKRNDDFNKDFYTLQKQEDEDEVIQNISSLRQFLLQTDKDIYEEKIIVNEDQIKILNSYKELSAIDNTIQYYVVDEEVNIDNIYVLNNKENNHFKILPNPLINQVIFNSGEEDKLYKQEYNNKVIKTIVQIERKIGGSNLKGTMLVTKYKYKCSRCGEEFTKLPYQLSGKLAHGCDGYESEAGVQKYYSIDKKQYTSDSYMNLHLYECILRTIGKQTELKKKIHLSCGSTKIKPGIYEVEVLHLHISPTHDSDKKTILLMLNHKEIKPDVSEDTLFIEDSGEVIARDLDIPQVKINDVVQSIRLIYKKYVNEDLGNQGTWLQFATAISGCCKLFYETTKLGISVMSNKSLSKTYSASRIAVMLDKDYYFSQSSNEISPAGLKGGINTGKMINGQAVKIFEEGLITIAGLTVFDEASKFYIDKVMNENLKQLPQKVVQHNKIGGETVDQNYTPILLSNFTDHDIEYKKSVRENYITLKKNYYYTSAQGNKFNKKELETKLTSLNYYLPLYAYYDKYSKDMELVKAFAYVRKTYDMNHVDWKTGGRVEASDRLLFDVAVSNKEKTLFDLKPGEMIDTSSSNLNPPEPEFLPTMEFMDELINRFKIKDINLYEEFHNSKEVNNQLQQIKNSISDWLQNDGIDVFYNLGKGNVKIDPKLNSLLFIACTTVQLIEDVDSTELSQNVKDWLKIFLTKCKRGMSQNEYNYIDNDTKYHKDIEFNFITVDMDIIEQQKKEEIDKAKKDAVNDFKNKDNVDEYIVKDNDVNNIVSNIK